MLTRDLNGLRIAVTGASGFVGDRLVQALVANGATVFAFGRRAQCALPGASYTSWDITTGPLVDAPRVDVVVHCAGTVTDWGPRELFEACHEVGTRNVLGSFPGKIVHLSTASVYDPFIPKVRVREDAPLPKRYLNAYSETKARAESIVAVRTDHVILRPHAIYGPGDTVLLPRILEAYRFGRLVAVGTGRNLVSLTHVDNLVDACVLAVAALHQGQAHGIYNVADAEPVVLHDALTRVLEATGRAPRIVYLPRPMGFWLGGMLERSYTTLGVQHAPRLTRYRVAQLASEYTLDLTRATHELGYRPTRDLFGYLSSGAVAADLARLSL